LVLVMSRDATQPIPPRAQPELSIARTFTLPAARTFDLTASATVSTDATDATMSKVLRPGDVTPGRHVSGSGFLAGCLSCRAGGAFDDDPTTVWQTPFDQVRGQWAQVDSDQPVTINYLDLGVIADGRHSVPTRLRLDVDGKSREIAVPPIADTPGQRAPTEVRIAFPAVRGRRIRLTIDDVREERTLLFATGATRLEPVGIAGFGIPAVTTRPANTGAVDSGCRSDLVAIDGRPVPVRVTGAVAAARTTAGLAVTLCRGAIGLGAGAHVVTTARGKDVGFSIDRLVLASGTATTPLSVASGHVRVASVGAPVQATRTPVVDVVRNGDTKLRAHVAGATKPFWLVLGESQSRGWHARVVGGHDLGASQLVDGYANGWLVTPPASGAFDVVLEWTPQRQVQAAIWLSLLGALICLAIIGVTWRRRSVITAAATALAADAEVDLAWSVGAPALGPVSRTRVRWLAPLLAGMLGALVVTPWVGVLAAAVAFVVVVRPRLRAPAMLAPAALLALCALYIVVEQYRYRYPSVFEWPTVFPRARTLAWIAVVLLASDAVVEILRSRPDRAPIAKREPDEDPGAS
jgi:hypothetical protein